MPGETSILERVDAPAARGEPLRMAHVLLSLDIGGLERNVVNQVRQAERLNQKVWIICLEREGKMAERVRDLGGTVISMNKQPGLQWKLIGQLEKTFREFGPQVVHTHELATLLYGGRAAKKAGVPLVVHTEHGKESYHNRLKTRLLGRIAARAASRFYCLTEDMASAVRSHKIVPASKVAVICNGIDSTPFHERYDAGALRRELGIPENARVIGTVGRLAEIKNQEFLIRAFAAFRKEVPETHLLLVGDGPLKEKLEGVARELGVWEAVHFAGYQSQTAPYYSLMEVFALTSRSEGMPQAAVEASFSGVPVVASRVGGLPELVEDGRTGLLFEAGREEKFISAVRALFSDREKASMLSEAARAKVTARFEIRRMAEEYHQYYLEMLKVKS